MFEFFGPDFWEADLPDDYDCPDAAEGDDSTVDPAEIDASEDGEASGEQMQIDASKDGATSGDKMKIRPLGAEKPSGPFGNSCSDCSGSCWLTCGGTCKYSWSGTMN